MKRLGSIIDEKNHSKRPKNLSREFQVFGVYLCENLGDTNYPMYMRLAKTTDRAILNEALKFTRDYPKAKSKPKLFLWKLKQLKNEKVITDR